MNRRPGKSSDRPPMIRQRVPRRSLGLIPVLLVLLLWFPPAGLGASNLADAPDTAVSSLSQIL